MMPVDVSPRILESGDVERAILERSEAALICIAVEKDGVETVPRAKVTVLTCDSSDLALLNILTAASELENLAGNCGRNKGELLKKRGDGG